MALTKEQLRERLRFKKMHEWTWRAGHGWGYSAGEWDLIKWYDDVEALEAVKARDDSLRQPVEWYEPGKIVHFPWIWEHRWQEAHGAHCKPMPLEPHHGACIVVEAYAYDGNRDSLPDFVNDAIDNPPRPNYWGSPIVIAPLYVNVLHPHGKTKWWQREWSFIKKKNWIDGLKINTKIHCWGRPDFLLPRHGANEWDDHPVRFQKFGGECRPQMNFTIRPFSFWD